MPHLCPECNQECTCHGDTGRIVRIEIPEEGCAHCAPLEDEDPNDRDGEDDDDWDDPEDEDLDIDDDEDEANAW